MFKSILASLALFALLAALTPATADPAAIMTTQKFPKIDVSCDVCLGAVYLLDKLIAANYTEREIEKPFIAFCNEFVFHHSEHPMCPGIVAAYAPSIFYIATQTYLVPQEVCGTLHVHCASQLCLRASPLVVLQLDQTCNPRSDVEGWYGFAHSREGNRVVAY